MSRSLVEICSLALLLARLAGGAEVSTTISAETGLIVPVSSEDEVVLSCLVTGAEGYSPLWELSGRQTRSTSVGRFIIETSSDNHSSNLTVTRQGRESIGLEVISVQCHADNPAQFRLVLGNQTFHIIQFEAPGPVEGLELTYHSQAELRLQWLRPKTLHPEVPVSYSVIINNTDTKSTQQSSETSETYVSVDQSMAQSCQLHSFSVTANTTAGPSPPATILHSIPISLNITPVSQSQRVASLTLSATGPNITVSFLPASSCGARFPVLNHSVEVEGLEGEVVLDGALPKLVAVSLTSASIPGLRLDQVLRITITACTHLTCLSPSLPLVAVTTDTQEASVVFFSTAVSLNCSFAAGSSATGCLFVFRLTNQDLTENATVSYSGTSGPLFNSSCGQLSNTRGAYDEEVLVFDIEADGSLGSQSISARVAVDEDPDNFTCPLPTIEVETTRDVLSPGAIAGIAVASVFAAIFLAGFATVFIILVVLVRREKKGHPGQTWHESATNVILQRFDPSKWRTFTDGPGEEEDSFTPGQNDKEVQKSPVAVMVLHCDSESRVSVEPLGCPASSSLLSNLKRRRKRRGAKAYVRLYPEQLPDLETP